LAAAANPKEDQDPIPLPDFVQLDLVLCPLLPILEWLGYGLEEQLELFLLFLQRFPDLDLL
jgi:hypothetical protein